MNNGFQSWWDKINSMLYRVLVVLFAAFIISQVLLMNQTLKTFISRTDKLEGKSIADSQLFIKTGEVEITIDNYSSLNPLVFYLNGEKIKTQESKSIRLQVKENDVLEVSGAGYNDTAVLKVTDVSEDVMVPELGKLIYVNNNLVMIDHVRLE